MTPRWTYRWTPRTLPDAAAVARLREAFPRPPEPMGEAWFMSEERYYYTDMFENGIRVDDCVWEGLDRALFDITAGTQAFGAHEEWRVWYHHILAQLSDRSHLGILAPWSEHLVSGFMSQHPEGVDAIYPQFLCDVLDTVGCSLMHPELWDGDEIVLEKSLLSYKRGIGAWEWYRCVSGDFSAAMFLVLKYLPPALVDGWVESLLALPSRYHQAQLLLWLLGSRDAMTGRLAHFADYRSSDPVTLEWQDSHCLKYPRPLPAASLAAFRNAIESRLRVECALEWLLAFETVPVLKDEIVGLGRDKDFLGMFDSEGRFALYRD